MNLLINLPTRSRPQKCLEILDKYQSLSTYENTRYVISCDEDDETMNNYEMVKLIGHKKNTQMVFNENKINIINPENGGVEKSKFTTKIQAINSGVKRQKFDICLLASDDMHPEVKGYDLDIVENMKKFFPDTDGVLWYNDGYQGDKLNTLCILGKKYYDRFGYIYHPSYITLYCDDEFTRVSKALNKCQYIDKTIIRHKHWSHKDNNYSRDSLDQKNDVFAGFDEQTFNTRKLKNFP